MHDATDPRPPHSIIPEAITAPILVGYNGSTSSRHALAYAAGMARRMARPLMLAHVQPTPGRYAIAGQWIPPSEDPAELLDWMHTALTETIGPHGLTVQLVQRNGDAARQLAELASETHADAIVLGAPEHWVHRIIGSVPVWLTRHARCPVIVVP
jgi:nucleotide-binding universal stress UspA family protein